MTFTPKQERNIGEAALTGDVPTNAPQSSPQPTVTAVWPDADPGWRIRSGVGLLIHAPGLSEERREAIRREDERERLQAERDAELRQQAAAERAAELLFRGVQPHSVGDVITLAAYGVTAEEFAANQDLILQREARLEKSQDKAEQRREEAAAEERGEPKPWKRPPRWEIAAKQRELDDHEQSPATLAQLHKVEGALTQLKAKIYAATGRKL